ncbi:MAG TPA: hypothetical protein VFL53_16115 [Pseudolabrys sp.]|nr:hypothetical protein [Pseudolabrys sp.]
MGIRLAAAASTALLAIILAAPANSTTLFSTGTPDDRMASASRPDSTGKIEIETADDFVLAGPASITGATFTGLLGGGAGIADVGEVAVKIYRVFPSDSDVAPTSGPPVFSTPKVPTRVNSPADIALGTRSAAASSLTFSTTGLGSVTALNSVLNGINPKPNQTTGGDGAVTGQEVLFSVSFTTPFSLPSGHYFFVPEVQVTTAGGNFFWLSAPSPIVDGTGPFSPDLQGWIRNADLAPDWLRVGTDVVGAGEFNFAFSLQGDIASETPLPATLPLFAGGLGALSLLGWRRKQARAA